MAETEIHLLYLCNRCQWFSQKGFPSVSGQYKLYLVNLCTFDSKHAGHHAVSRSHFTQVSFRGHVSYQRCFGGLCVRFSIFYLRFVNPTSQKKNNSCNDMQYVISLYENTMILIKWINMKINQKKGTLCLVPHSKKDKNHQ